ncbi:hypothetical protein PsYK624_066230 [Phanerochaete sordida]|uniref:Uncharacterized protein n=1 Tax=Phanerochaete sordida TaxID=48140 RepID=A0A9P3G9M2_9APHY|nr:hypothetical protein PsYK624_066230 [Phanerochaete sordida]
MLRRGVGSDAHAEQFYQERSGASRMGRAARWLCQSEAQCVYREYALSGCSEVTEFAHAEPHQNSGRDRSLEVKAADGGARCIMHGQQSECRRRRAMNMVEGWCRIAAFTSRTQALP